MMIIQIAIQNWVHKIELCNWLDKQLLDGDFSLFFYVLSAGAFDYNLKQPGSVQFRYQKIKQL